MRILITGGNGFIGSHLTRALVAHGHEVICVDRDPPSTTVGDVVTYVQLDLSERSLAPLLTNVDLIVNLASTLGIRFGIDQPLTQLENNIRCTKLVLEAASSRGVRVLHASSSAVYGNSRSSTPINESDPINFSALLSPSANYAFSKLGQEVLVNAYREQFDLNVQIVRLFNSIGGEQGSAFGHVLPSFLDAALAGRPLIVHGSGKQRRTFMHVSDTVKAMMLVIDHFEQGGVYNIGGTEEISILDLAERVINITGTDPGINFVNNSTAFCPSFDEPDARVPDIQRIRDLGFVPTYDLTSAIARSVSERQRSMRTSLA
jgi:UDP-glucose 4-epimerase